MQFVQFGVLIPVAVRALHEAHAALRQAARQQALPSEVARHRIVQAVELLGLRRLLVRLECFGRFDLHAKRQLEGADPGVEIRIVIVQLRIAPVHFLKHVELIALIFGGKAAGNQVRHRLFLDLFHLHVRAADGGALVITGQEAGAPVVLTAVAETRFDRHKAGQVLVLRS